MKYHRYIRLVDQRKQYKTLVRTAGAKLEPSCLYIAGPESCRLDHAVYVPLYSCQCEKGKVLKSAVV